MTADPPLEHRDDESLVDLRCSVVVMHDAELLLINRGGDAGDWVLPGGRPRDGESLQSCARRETFEETGLRVDPNRCGFVAEVIDPYDNGRVVELVFVATLTDRDERTPGSGEAGNVPAWVSLDRVRALHLRPPIAGYLPSLARGSRGTAAYLGNLWRPGRGSTAARP